MDKFGRKPLDLKPIEEHQRVVGPPGTGKTTFLTLEVGYDARKYGSENVVAVSFTRAAAAELASRVETIDEEQVGTLHSLAYRALDRPTFAEDSAHLKEFSEAHPEFARSGGRDVSDIALATERGLKGDWFVEEYSRLRNLEMPRRDWPTHIVHFARTWEAFKRDTESIDYTDMIELASTDTDSAPGYPAVLIADEAQDLSRLQFRLLCRWSGECQKIVMACDPDQSIYGFAGADPSVFRTMKPSRQVVLDQSYRVPKRVHAYAQGLIRRIRDRDDVVYKPKDDDGALYNSGCSWRSPDALIPEWEKYLADGDTVLVLASCSYMLTPTLALLRRAAIPFANPLRKKRGDWNPLTERGKVSTVRALRDFLTPHRFGNRLWTKLEVDNWFPVLARVFRRTSAETLRAVEDDIDDLKLYRLLVNLAKDGAAFSAGTMSAPPVCVDWFERHLKTVRKKAAEFPCDVARRRGIEAVVSAPRMLVGTCHSYKGGEADHVYVFPDLSRQGYDQYRSDPASLIRLFYVAATRAKKTLTLTSSASANAFHW